MKYPPFIILPLVTLVLLTIFPEKSFSMDWFFGKRKQENSAPLRFKMEDQASLDGMEEGETDALSDDESVNSTLFTEVSEQGKGSLDRREVSEKNQTSITHFSLKHDLYGDSKLTSEQLANEVARLLQRIREAHSQAEQVFKNTGKLDKNSNNYATYSGALAVVQSHLNSFQREIEKVSTKKTIEEKTNAYKEVLQRVREGENLIHHSLSEMKEDAQYLNDHHEEMLKARENEERHFF